MDASLDRALRWILSVLMLCSRCSMQCMKIQCKCRIWSLISFIYIFSRPLDSSAISALCLVLHCTFGKLNVHVSKKYMWATNTSLGGFSTYSPMEWMSGSWRAGYLGIQWIGPKQTKKCIGAIALNEVSTNKPQFCKGELSKTTLRLFVTLWKPPTAEMSLATNPSCPTPPGLNLTPNSQCWAVLSWWGLQSCSVLGGSRTLACADAGCCQGFLKSNEWQWTGKAVGDSTAGSTASVSAPGGLKWSNRHSFGSPYIEVGIVYQIKSVLEREEIVPWKPGWKPSWKSKAPSVENKNI